jgi:hypothetical protein
MRPRHSSSKHTTVTAKHGHKKETAATKEDSSYRRRQPKDTCGSTWNAQEKRREAAADFQGITTAIQGAAPYFRTSTANNQD